MILAVNSENRENWQDGEGRRERWTKNERGAPTSNRLALNFCVGVNKRISLLIAPFSGCIYFTNLMMWRQPGCCDILTFLVKIQLEDLDSEELNFARSESYMYCALYSHSYCINAVHYYNVVRIKGLKRMMCRPRLLELTTKYCLLHSDDIHLYKIMFYVKLMCFWSVRVHGLCTYRIHRQCRSGFPFYRSDGQVAYLP